MFNHFATNLMIIFDDLYSLGCFKPGISAYASRLQVLEEGGVNIMLKTLSSHTVTASYTYQLRALF